jgi:enoyl-CoA hydratase/carnithine racemase
MVSSEVDQGVMLLTLRRSDKRNAMVQEMADSIHDVLTRVDNSPDLRATVIAGEPPSSARALISTFRSARDLWTAVSTG